MIATRPFGLALLAFLLLLAPAGAAQENDAEAPPPTAVPPSEPLRFVTEHTGRFGGRDLRYRAVAGETFLRDADGAPRAAFFTFAYLEQGVDDPSRRPVTFVWNGGPGSSSVWLHMGTFGPRRVEVPSDARDDGAPPYPIRDNPLTPLDLTDLVFVDPVGTGFSRPLGEHEGEEFWGLREDAESIADFIRVWITENGRWNSPKYLAGESFGTTRAAAVAGILESGGESISLNGLILISQALDYAGSTPSPTNPQSFLTYLPTMAATAWHHRRVPDRPDDLEAFLAEVRDFVYDEYAPALLRGSALEAETRARIRAELARYTGLDEDWVERADLRLHAWRFLKELLRDQGLAVGRLDGRYTGDDIDDTADSAEGDPSSYGIDSAYVAALHSYMASELGVVMERPYVVSNRELGGSWRWRTVSDERSWEPAYVNTAPDLARAMRRNSELRVLVASGYYDFATPFFDAEVTFHGHGIPLERVTMTYYRAGHMMYLHQPSHERFLADVRAFLEQGAR